MTSSADISRIASLMGDPARANMLTELMSGEARTAGELAKAAGVTAPTASGHLARLTEGGLLFVEKQGRHRYYRLAGPGVASVIEQLMGLAASSPPVGVRIGPKDPQLRRARICYDHLAGELGVALFNRLVDCKLIELYADSVAVTPKGQREFSKFGIDIQALELAKRPLCKTCLDWSERRPHLAGSLGARLLTRLYELKWARRLDGTRIVKFTPKGEMQLTALFR
ncbi:MAG TPA: helix-turn-helix transcriptional regulator [Hyphomicrobiaceae bacterium]|nr:helix-turn-helix transcriptional regulator [Hyphomicrobiaceae bacterium]